MEADGAAGFGGGPTWISVLSTLNPLTYIVDATRDLFAGDLTRTVLSGTLAAVGVLVAGLAVGLRALRADSR